MLEEVALGILVFAVVTLFYGIIAIHDIPYEISKHRNHPHQDSIHVAGWVSLMTLHILWPFLWIWATLYREDRGWGFSDGKSPGEHIQNLEQKIDDLASRLNELEGTSESDVESDAGSDVTSTPATTAESEETE